jgi:hypothetical protein
MTELNNYDLLAQLVADHQAELRREATGAGLSHNASSHVLRLLLIVLGSAALLALLFTLGIVLN